MAGIPDHIKVRDLSAIDEQIKLVDMNTRQFIAGLPANNVLLTGSKGTGKSSLIKALLNKYSKKTLRLIEVDKADLHELPQIIDLISSQALLPEYMAENLESTYKGEEIHASENVEEKISLSERFGLWVHFDAFTQDEYVTIASYWVKTLSFGAFDVDEGVIRRSLQWALERGSRSGRVAYHFAKNEVGARKLRDIKSNRTR